MSIVETLNEVGKEARSKIGPSIDWGGCGVYAGNVAKRLNTLGHQAWCRLISRPWFYNNPPKDSEILPKLLEEYSTNLTVHKLNENGLFVSHLVVELLDEQGQHWLHDSTHSFSNPKEIKEEWDGLIIGNIDPSVVLEWVADAGNWNREFDRRHGIPIIKKAIDHYLPIAA